MEKGKVHHLDFLKNKLPSKCAKLVIWDPPYFEIKGEFDFIWPSFEAYLIWFEACAVEAVRLLADNGTLFIWGHAKRIAYCQVILDKYLTLENHIAWNKTDCQTRKGIRNYNIFPPVKEHLLMYSRGAAEKQIAVFEIRDYIRAEIIKAKGKIVFKDINKAIGAATNGGGVASACLSLSKTEPAFITLNMYVRLQEYCHPHLSRDYEELQDAYDKNKRHFINRYGLDDVWSFSQEVNISGGLDHDTIKPEKVTRVMINSASKPGDLVIIPMSGSGTEAAMCEKEGREWIAFDIDARHVKNGNSRVNKIRNKPQLF